MKPSRWDEFWFGRASLTRLAAFRIALLATALYAVFKYRLQGDTGTWHPIYAFHLLGLERPSAGAAKAVEVALLGAIAFGLIGLFTRTACAIVAVLLFLWIGTAYSLHDPHHDCIPLVFGLAALPFAPVGARLSLDAAFARWRRAARGEDPRVLPSTAELAALPLRVTQVTIAIGYSFAAATKLAASGFTWANGYTLQAILLQFHSPWTDYVVGSVFLCSLLSVATLVIQGGFALVFVVPWTRWIFLPGAILFHLVTWKTMATGPFVTLWFTLASFVALERVPLALRRTVGHGSPFQRSAWAVAWAAAAWLVVGLLAQFVPALALLALVPAAAAVLLSLVPTPRIELWADLSCAKCRRVVAVVAALDWAGRVRVRLAEENKSDASHGAYLEIASAGARTSSRRHIAAILARNLPLALPFSPLTLFLRRSRCR